MIFSWLWIANILSVIQRFIEKTSLWIGRGWRRLLPFAIRAGYDMVLLRSGYWIPRICDVSETNTKAIYDADTHRILDPAMADKPAKRWDWLSVNTGRQNRDTEISDFFSGLRHSASLIISNQEAMYLFASQKGWLPEGDIEVTLRTGETETICFLSGFQKTRSQEEISTLVRTFDHVK